MSIFDRNLNGLNKVDIALMRIKAFYNPDDQYYVLYSGGKDSDTILELVKMSGVKYEAHHNHTGIDHPKLVRYIKEVHPYVIHHMPKETIWNMIPRKKMPPTRMVRYCCDILKERGGEGRFCVCGVRWYESARRKNNKYGLTKNGQIYWFLSKCKRIT